MHFTSFSNIELFFCCTQVIAIRRGEDGVARGTGGILHSSCSPSSAPPAEGPMAKRQPHHTQRQQKQADNLEDNRMQHLGEINIAVLDASQCSGSGKLTESLG